MQARLDIKPSSKKNFKVHPDKAKLNRCNSLENQNFYN